MKLQAHRLRGLIRDRGLTIETFGKRLNMTRNGVYDILKRKYLKPDLIEKICEVLGVQNIDFIEYDLPPNVKLKLDVPNGTYKSTEGNIIFVPLLAYGGFLTGYANKVFMDGLQRFFLPGITGEHFAFEVDGMSMHDFLSPGDWAIAQMIEKLEYMVKGRPYVLQTIDGIVIKYFSSIKDDRAYFHSHNSDYETIHIPLRNIKKVYYVAHVFKKTASMLNK